MQLALCYSGSVRTFAHCISSHAALIPSADIYIATWTNPQRISKVAPPWYEKAEINVPEKITRDYLESLLPEHFHLRGCLVEDYFTCPPVYKGYEGLFYQYHKIRQAFSMVPDEYDLIARLRMDISLRYFPNSPTEKILHDPYVWADEKILNKKMNEMIWVSNYELMDKTTRIVDNLGKIKSMTNQHTFFGESICYHNLLLENVMDRVDFFEYGYKVWR